MSTIEKRHNELQNAIDGSCRFYSIKTEPLPTKTCFDVVFKTYANPAVTYTATVRIPAAFPFEPPSIHLKNRKTPIVFKFLQKDVWKPSMSIREVLIEASHYLSKCDLKPLRPTVKIVRPAHLVK